MDELKILVDIVKDLPNAVLYVLAGFLFYKLFLLGSITAALYKAFSLLIVKVHDWKCNGTINKNYSFRIGSLCITGVDDNLMEQLKRIRNQRVKIDSQYIHGSDVCWLSEAIDDKIEKDRAEAEKSDES